MKVNSFCTRSKLDCSLSDTSLNTASSGPPNISRYLAANNGTNSLAITKFSYIAFIKAAGVLPISCAPISTAPGNTLPNCFLISSDCTTPFANI